MVKNLDVMVTSEVTSDAITHNLNICLHFTKSLSSLVLKIPPSSYIPVLTCFFFVIRSIHESDKIAKKLISQIQLVNFFPKLSVRRLLICYST